MSKGKSRTGLYVAIALIIIIIVVGVVIAVMLMNPPASGTQLTIYGGEVSTTSYGFGNSANSITSPGPDINLRVGETYTMTFRNSGELPHAWEITSQRTTGSQVLFGAQIGSVSFIAPGSSGSVTFTPDQTGNFFYICPVPGHVDLGMWGNVIVTS